MSWEKVKLTDISRPRQWKTISTSDLKPDGYPVYGANGKIGFYNEYTHEFPTLLITCRGATCGTLNISEPKSYVNGNAMALDNLSNNVNLKFLFYALNKRGLHDTISGSAQPQITREGLSNVELRIPPLSTQKAIAEKLDKADALRKKDHELLKSYDELAQSVFLEMFGDPVTNEKGWEIKKLDDICLKITDGTHHSPENIEEGVPYVTAKHIKENGLDFNSKPTFISIEDHKPIFARCNAEFGDVLYIKDGATTGIACINTFNEEISLLSSVALFKLNKSLITNYFLCSFLNNEKVKIKLITEFMSGAAIKRYTIQKLRSFKILIPPLSLQQKFVQIIENIEAQKVLVKQQTEESEHLFQALLQESFG